MNRTSSARSSSSSRRSSPPSGTSPRSCSGRPAGITRVHGQEQEVTLGARTVILHPLFHPAAALYTPSMLRSWGRTSHGSPRSSTGSSSLPLRARSSRPRPGSSPSRSSSACSSAARPVGSDRSAVTVATGSATETEAAAARPRPGSAPGTSPRPESWGRGRRRSCAAPAARSASPRRSRARRSPSAIATRGTRMCPTSTSTASSACPRPSGRPRAVLRRRGRVRRVAGGRARCAAARTSIVRIEHRGGDRRWVELAAADGALPEGIAGC